MQAPRLIEVGSCAAHNTGQHDAHSSSAASLIECAPLPVGAGLWGVAEAPPGNGVLPRNVSRHATARRHLLMKRKAKESR